MRKHHWLMAGAAVLLLLLWFVFRFSSGTTPGAENAGRSFDSQDLESAPAVSAPPAVAAPDGSAMPVIGTGARPPGGSVAPAAQVSAVPTARAAVPTPPNPQTEVEKVHAMITSYHTLMGENPVGTNAEIMKEIMGANPHQATLGPPEGQTLNGKGELVDPWGTPYFFHQLSRDVMEIHSAGPDKIMGTADDLMTR